MEPTVRREGLESIKAITYDPVNDIFYFTDRNHKHTSIFSLKVRDDTTFVTTPLVPRSSNELIEDLVYDFYDQALYWSDSGNKKIVKLVFDRSKNLKWQNETFLNVSDVAGLEIDSCKRNLYYTVVTEGKPSINVVSLDAEVKNTISFGTENHFKPVAIAMDHQQRRLYVADVRQYNSYSIDSIHTSGADYRPEIEKTHKMPRSVAVDGDYVYYVEGMDHELRRFNKFSGTNTSESFKDLPSNPTDIIVRGNFVTDLDAAACKVPEKFIKPPPKQPTNKICLHGGSLDKTTYNCMCTENYDGDSCEINLCYNFCLNGGDCSMNRNERSQRIEPKCSCKKGFVGDHCEIDVCSNFCLNDGKCTVGYNKKPKCGCNDKFSGARCENWSVEMAPVIIESHATAKVNVEPKTATEAPDMKIPESSEHEPEDHSEAPHNLIRLEDNEVQSEFTHCSSNSSYIYAICAVCITISLLLFLAILVVIKKFNRPLRPKIRKKYVVHKNIEPLTYRPTTEQCEVIIEDCCNMNICETVS